MNVYYTFGSDPRYPYPGGWVEVHAPDLASAHRIFRSYYPDRTPGVLNCAFCYTDEDWDPLEQLGPRGPVLEEPRGIPLVLSEPEVQLLLEVLGREAERLSDLIARTLELLPECALLDTEEEEWLEQELARTRIRERQLTEVLVLLSDGKTDWDSRQNSEKTAAGQIVERKDALQNCTRDPGRKGEAIW